MDSRFDSAVRHQIFLGFVLRFRHHRSNAMEFRQIFPLEGFEFSTLPDRGFLDSTAEAARGDEKTYPRPLSRMG